MQNNVGNSVCSSELGGVDDSVVSFEPFQALSSLLGNTTPGLRVL